MKIMVTGGAGFIGSHLVDALVNEGHEVVIYDNLDAQVHKKVPDYLNSQATFIQKDIRDQSDFKDAMKDVEVIFHEASAVGVGQSMYQVGHYVDVNTLGTAKMLELLVNEEHSVKKLIMASSMSIYGEGAYVCEDDGAVHPSGRPEDQLKQHDWVMKCPICNKNTEPIPTSEAKPLIPTSIYAITKKDQEEMCLVIGKTYGIPTVALRYFNVYGPRQSLNNPYTGVAAIFSSRIKNDNKPLIFEDGKQSRDFVSVHDIVQANLLVLKKSEADYNTYNVGTGIPTSIAQITLTLEKLYGKPELGIEIADKYRSGDIRDCYADISRLESLGYSPKYTLEDGMKELVEWGEKQKAKDDFEAANAELQKYKLVR
ncbi:MAG: SDR family NAD(P)-dependent oxidoreductase [Thermoplasmata archaeon]|nr:MAG: SDR family NAD(P)-dependent oxidoreductase [Thermoplasmata archaeon]